MGCTRTIVIEVACCCARRTTVTEKPAHENFAKDMEAEKRKMDFHDVRRAFQAKGEQAAAAPAPAPAPARFGGFGSFGVRVGDFRTRSGDAVLRGYVTVFFSVPL